MWQRIQTVWLAVGTIALLVALFLPMFTLTSDVNNVNDIYQLSFQGLKSTGATTPLNNPQWPLFFITICGALLPVYTIITFKNRKLQMKLCIANFFINLLSIGYLVALLFHYASIYHTRIAINIWIVLPIVALFAMVRAYMGVRKDEAMVKAADRLR